jgi:hypothetical protein
MPKERKANACGKTTFIKKHKERNLKTHEGFTKEC